MELLKKTAQNLEKNNYKTYIVNSKEEVYGIVKSLVNKDSVIGFGGSESLKETAVLDLIEKDGYTLLDRRKEGADIPKIYRDAFSADFYLCSSNAITEDGLLYNVDGNANRVAALMFGPENVIVVAGVNKIVKNIDEAVKRVKEYVAPKNCVRLGLDTYCAKTGRCIALDSEEKFTGCDSPKRICCDYVISGRQRIKDRVKVILVNEELGY